MMLLEHYIYLLSYIIKFEKNKITVCLMVEDKKLLENYKNLWTKIKRLMGIDF